MTKVKKANKTEQVRRATSQLFNFAPESYLERTARPISAVIFLLPLIVFYEVGTFRINTDVLHHSQIRVVAFVWLQDVLESLGFGGKLAWLAPPLAVVVILIALQITSGKPWRFWFGDVGPMALECILLAVPLIVLTLFMNSPAPSEGHVHWFDGGSPRAQPASLPTCSSTQGNWVSASPGPDTGQAAIRPLLPNFVTGIGAGIYEELVFRLILICLLMLLFQDILGLTHTSSIVLAVLISAALFSAYHHIDFFTGRPNVADPFSFTKFAFRTMAGIYFALLYAIRGFGITAGTHAAYNIIAVSITAGFFH
jgi:Type II CAAX prenyl endopeptidase Rce1-like